MVARNPGETASWSIVTFKFPVVGKPINGRPLGLVSFPFLYKMKIALSCPKSPALVSSSYFAPWWLPRSHQHCIHETIFFLLAKFLRLSSNRMSSLICEAGVTSCCGQFRDGEFSSLCPWWTVSSSGKGVWFVSEGAGGEESSRSRNEETSTSGSTQPPAPARAGQVSEVGRESKSCILVRLCQLLLPVDLVLYWVALCLWASLVSAYFRGWTKGRRQVDTCSVMWTQFLPQQSRILLFIKTMTVRKCSQL